MDCLEVTVTGKKSVKAGKGGEHPSDSLDLVECIQILVDAGKVETDDWVLMWRDSHVDHVEFWGSYNETFERTRELEPVKTDAQFPVTVLQYKTGKNWKTTLESNARSYWRMFGPI